MILSFDDFLVEFIKKREEELNGGTIFKPGCNGLYNDPETPIRNNCHYLVIYSYLYSITNQDIYYKKLVALENYILNNHYKGFTYECRNKKNKDLCNGLIGTAWISEGLLSSYEVTKNKEILQRLLTIYNFHPFDYNKAVWPNRVEPNGDLLTIDRTLNHQIWFASGLAMLLQKTEDVDLQRKLDVFLNKLPKLIKFTNGLIYHTIGISKEYFKTRLKRFLKRSYRNEMKMKEAGYQNFNFLGLLILDKYSNSTFLNSAFLEKAITKLENPEYKKLLSDNNYAYPYNPVGIESSVVYSNLGFNLKKVIEKLNNQFEVTWSKECFGFSKTNDENTLNARLYEILYLDKNYRNKLFFDTEKGKWTYK